MKLSSMVQGNVAMADPSSSRPDLSTVDEAPRPPTFVRIDAPVPSILRKMLVVLGVGVALTTALGWAAYRLRSSRLPL